MWSFWFFGVLGHFIDTIVIQIDPNGVYDPQCNDANVR